MNLLLKVYYRICTIRHIRIEIIHERQNLLGVLTWVNISKECEDVRIKMQLTKSTNLHLCSCRDAIKLLAFSNLMAV
jgi:hypothetical protein